jgi:hypothetical protein
MLAKTHYGGVFADMTSLKADVIREASAFAAARGMVAIPVNLHQQDAIPGVRFPRIEYQFRVVSKTDSEARRTSLNPVMPEQRERIDVNVKQGEQARDVYGELLKLDDLRKRGVLTEAEFDEQKRRLLSK